MKKLFKIIMFILGTLIIAIVILIVFNELYLSHLSILRNAKWGLVNISINEINYKNRTNCYTSEILPFKIKYRGNLEAPLFIGSWGYNYGIKAGEKIYFTDDLFHLKKANQLNDIIKCPLYKSTYYQCIYGGFGINYDKDVANCVNKIESIVTCDHFKIYTVFRYLGNVIFLSIDEKQEILRHECP